MKQELNFTHEIRFKVTEDLYSSLQEAAFSCSQPVSVFARQLLGEAFLKFRSEYPQFGDISSDDEED